VAGTLNLTAEKYKRYLPKAILRQAGFIVGAAKTLLRSVLLFGCAELRLRHALIKRAPADAMT